jgi:hypothetical protein
MGKLIYYNYGSVATTLMAIPSTKELISIPKPRGEIGYPFRDGDDHKDTGTVGSKMGIRSKEEKYGVQF